MLDGLDQYRHKGVGKISLATGAVMEIHEGADRFHAGARIPAAVVRGRLNGPQPRQCFLKRRRSHSSLVVQVRLIVQLWKMAGAPGEIDRCQRPPHGKYQQWNIDVRHLRLPLLAAGRAEFHGGLLRSAGGADENNQDQGAEVGADEKPEQQSGPEWRHVTARKRSMNSCVAGVLIGLDVAELFA